MSTAIKEINGIKYALDSSDCTATVVRQDKLSMTEIVIPSYVKSLFKKYKVTRVDDEAFSNRKITRVVIESGITDIGQGAFSDCHKLTDVKLPDTLTVIPENMFYACQKLAKIIIPQSVTRIEYGAFQNCSQLNELKIPKSVTSIGAGAFENCAVTVFDNNVYYVDKWAVGTVKRLVKGYVGYGSLHISLRSNTVGIAASAFSEITKELENMPYYIREDYHYQRVNYFDIPNGVKYIGDAAFADCCDISSITLPESVIAMGARVFEGCCDLHNVNIPNKVTEIGDYAFKDCKAIGSIKIPDGVKRIGAGAFMDCTGITEIRIPESVIEIGENAFSGCTALTINCEAESEPSGWNEDWNNSMRPVNWNVNADGAIEKAKS